MPSNIIGCAILVAVSWVAFELWRGASESPLPWSQKVKTKSLNSVKYGVFGNRDKDGK